MPPRFDTLSAAAAWFESWLGEAALPLWADAGVDPVGGLFQEQLSVEGQPIEAPRRARAQARQVFVFASAAGAGYGEAWLATARKGWARFVAAYRRPDGLFRNRCAADGTVLDGEADNYEQAFVLLAMAALMALDPAAGGLERGAKQVLAALQPRRTPGGGFKENGPHPFQANCHMHLFESAMAWEAVGDASWRTFSDDIATLALTRFIDPETGLLREFFDGEWRALKGEGGLVEPGHQFEWAWLLDRWGRARGRGDALAAARRLFENGLKGVDPQRGVAVNALWEDFSVRDGSARLWPQTEHLKAAMALGDAQQGLRAAEGLAQYLDTPARGAWRDKLKPDGTFVEEPAPATSFYHLIVAILELTSRAEAAA
ncbi:AGE family epimerase/isomerase [Phenylobacterium sp.]|uniref:AGE family epimerase/isomerase n=1 Tax=Phenylobacterium sp. TaxID=1871053 RepID=UPI001202012A|nr:AGE family epimerase/isomerase [Phenylobacterium sp.]THD61040.1 MAG: AGE family epimerase/isomerase [Phenylobacterium sp.]